MSDVHLVGIDLALSSVRVTAYDRYGDIVLSGTADVDEQTVSGWERALREAAVYLPESRTVVSTVGTSGTVVAVDEYGSPMFDPRWYYETEPKQAAQLGDLNIAKELSSKGYSLSATSPLAKILALRERSPNRFEDVEWILSPATWLLYRLRYPKGDRWRNLQTDWTNALKFGADITLNAPQWFESLFEAVGVSSDLFPSIQQPGTAAGHAESGLATDIGLADAELYQGLTDGNASVLASGCLYPGDCSIVCGSTSVVKYVSEEIEPHDALYYHRHPIEGYLPGAAFDTGVVLRAFCEQVLDISQEEGLKLARRVEPGDEPRIYLQGDRSPFFDPRVGTSLFDFWPEDGRSVDETRGQLVRGIATSIALSEYTYFPLLEEHFQNTVDRVHLVSGGESSGTDPFSWWNTLRASIWNREVLKMEPRTTVGPLIPAGIAAGIYESVDEASDRLLRVNGEVAADDRLRAEYESSKRRFADEWQAVAGLHDMIER
jgi:xylulokinase